MKKIYLVLTYTGTLPSKMIHKYTKTEFTHISISLDENLQQMYSFGRYYPYFAFLAGFIKEDPHAKTYKRFKDTKTMIYAMNVSDQQYEAIAQEIQYMDQNKENYRYNIIGLLAAAMNWNIERKNKYYCSQFVKHLFDTARIEHNLPDIVAPQDFMMLDDLQLIYKGKLQLFH